MNISIDTNILKRDRKLESSDISLLAKLSKLGLLKLHIPWVIYKEATSQNFIEIKTIIEKITKDLDNLDKKGLRDVEHFKFSQISKEISSIDVENSVKNHWDEFIESSGAILHHINEKHGELVMASYFAGQAPFPEPKSRKDIPDAFIYQALLTITEKNGTITFVCDDNNLREACSKIPSVTVVKNYSELYDLGEFKEIKEKYESIEHYADELIVLEENIDDIRAQAEEDIRSEIFNDYIITHPNIPDDNNEGKLIDIRKISLLNVDKAKIQFIDDFFYIPVQAEGVFSLEYFLYKADYYMLGDTRKIFIADKHWNDHYFLVEESFEVKFSFKYKIKKDNVDMLEMEAEDLNFEEVNIIGEE
jgi:hypothetical protein